jgi:hypothetical protein
LRRLNTANNINPKSAAAGKFPRAGRVLIEASLFVIATIVIPAAAILVKSLIEASTAGPPNARQNWALELLRFPGFQDGQTLAMAATGFLIAGIIAGRRAKSPVLLFAACSLSAPVLMTFGSCVDAGLRPGSHNLLGIEIVVHFVFSAPLICQGPFLLGMFVSRLIKDVKPKPYHADTCQACGYSLVGNRSGICSECGTPRSDSPSTLDESRTT